MSHLILKDIARNLMLLGVSFNVIMQLHATIFFLNVVVHTVPMNLTNVRSLQTYSIKCTKLMNLF